MALCILIGSAAYTWNASDRMVTLTELVSEADTLSASIIPLVIQFVVTPATDSEFVRSNEFSATDQPLTTWSRSHQDFVGTLKSTAPEAVFKQCATQRHELERAFDALVGSDWAASTQQTRLELTAEYASALAGVRGSLASSIMSQQAWLNTMSTVASAVAMLLLIAVIATSERVITRGMLAGMAAAELSDAAYQDMERAKVKQAELAREVFSQRRADQEIRIEVAELSSKVRLLESLRRQAAS